ncbi:beta-lactamase family protein [Luteimonas yindakuii]|uniref:Beta-lactamase family protein n=1 Tax=Luteimonas yindakuii TaxID=2565782 RepID=A0A4Z1R1F2_9GAMM|nr:serine hydrolase domain-containing protein [Luteimonas yindakuii]QCU72416.1 beta-lactamase family protein [Luteimonas yindakuii]TKS52756.1 beta-lactamase family protein [Luteimonas yindakuii]
MKDKVLRRRWGRAWQLGLVGMLMPLALGTTAQDLPLQAQVVPPAAEPMPVFPRPTDGRPEQRPPPSTAKPLPSSFDVREFEAMAQALVADQRVPGLAMAIVHNGRVLSARGYGITDVRAAEPVDAHTVFRLASLSKSFAGTIAGVLVSEGALRWDSKVVDYMPGLRLADPSAAQRVTVADVLSHRVGLPRHTYDRDIEAGTDYTTLVQRLSAANMACAPGDCYGYQNVAFSLVGDVVFATSGQFFSEAVSRRLFKPLGMNDASYGLEGIQGSPRWAKPHVRANRGWASLMPKPTYYRVAPAAGVNASISDMAQWLIAHTGHRPDVLPAPLLATLHSPIVGTPGEMRSRAGSWRRERLNAAGYGLGWRVYDYAGHRVVFHGGAVQGYRGVMAMLPERDFGMVVLWNSESSLPSGLMPTILDRALNLEHHRWLDVDIDDVLYAERVEDSTTPGAAASSAHARPH